MEKARRRGFIDQHRPASIERWLRGVFTFSDVRYGKKGQGDIVITNLKIDPFLEKQGVTLENYMGHTHNIERIETTGIFTNIFFGKKVLGMVIEDILAH